MFSARHATHSPAPSDRLFALVVDPGLWNLWDPEIRSAHVCGRPVTGARGRVQPKKGPGVRFVLTEVDPDRRVVNVLQLPLARVTFDHLYEPAAEGGTRLTHEIRVEGPFAPLFARLIGQPAARGLPEAMRRLATLAEQDVRAAAA